MGCYSCGSGFHSECIAPVGSLDKCCCSPPVGEPDSSSEGLDLLDAEEGPEDSREAERRTRAQRQGTRGLSRDASLRDQQSTGRKRAAMLYPLDKEANCEWKGLKYAGGGKYPIIGCIDGKQEARHHGPDKNTLNNEEGNVHKISAKCHNRWHARNDTDYEPENPGQAHDSITKATTEELLDNEIYYRTHTVSIVKED